MLLSWISDFWLACAYLAIVIHFVGIAVFFRFLVKARPYKKGLGSYPGVTVLKPCYMVEDNEEENYRQFFEQDYTGPYQLLFVASRETDPAVALVRKMIALYPRVDAELVISNTRQSYWPKIDAVYDGHLKAKHDHLIISDSDTFVRKDYVRQMVTALQEPGVSLVSTPQWDCGANNFGSALKVLANNCDSTIFVLFSDILSRKKRLALGHSIGFRLSEFRTLGDTWKVMNSFLAEDLAYGYLFSRAGKKAVLRNIFCPVNFSDKTAVQAFKQKVRWLLNQKMLVGNRFLYVCGALVYPEVPALFYMLFSGFSAASFLVFGAACLTRILISAITEIFYLGTFRMTPLYFWTIPLWDLMQIYFFAIGFFKETISYGKKTYRVVDRYFLSEIPG